MIKNTLSSTNEKMTKAEWAAKDRAKELGGIGHDVGGLLNYAALKAITVEQALVDWEKGYRGIIKIRNDVGMR
jgi:hypothetical protein